MLRAAKAGVRLEVTLDRTSVEAGGTVRAHLLLHNGRSEPLQFVEPCFRGAMTVQVAIPATPVGRDWPGIRGAFKEYALEHSQGTPMEWSVREPMSTLADAGPCHADRADGAPEGTATMDAGAVYENDFDWPAELVHGVPAPAGAAPLSVSVGLDPGGAGGGLVSFDPIEVTDTVTVLPAGVSGLSPAEAVDAALNDARFADWLAAEPRKSWENVNLFPMPGAHGVEALPEVPYWDVELFREPRSFAILLIDAMSGAVLHRHFCNAPCDQ